MPSRKRTPRPLAELAQEFYRPMGPFNPRTTLHKPSHFPCPFEQADDGRYLFMTSVGSQVVGGLATFAPDTDGVQVRVYTPEGQNSSLPGETILAEVARRLGLMQDLSGFDTLWHSDPVLSALPPDMLGARPMSPFSLYEFLVICTVLQNTVVSRTVHMAQTLADTLGQQYQFPSGEVLSSFWKPADLVALGEPALRDLKMGYRAKIFTRAAEYFDARPALEKDIIALAAQPEALRQELNAIYGIGPASVGYIMFEWFKLTNEFSHVSPWELKILSRLLFGQAEEAPQQLISFARKKWEPFTMLAVHAVFESIFWKRKQGHGPAWLDELIRL